MSQVVPLNVILYWFAYRGIEAVHVFTSGLCAITTIRNMIHTLGLKPFLIWKAVAI